MTVILSMHDYQKRKLPNPGYLAASSNRSDDECLNRDHLARVLVAREGLRDTSPAVPPPSITVRIDDWWDSISSDPYFWRTIAWGAVVAVFVAALIVVAS